MPKITPPATIGILYLGGTIGCAGTPLAPLNAATFLPHLQHAIETHVPNSTRHTWHFIAGTIKDSSALVPEDWAEMLAILLAPLHAHINHWIILHGTDTLAYSAAFLAAALAGSRLKVVISGSQLPLLDPQSLAVNQDSDALPNLKTSVAALQDRATNGWVAVAFNHHTWLASSVQKIHSQHRQAFSGQVPLRALHDDPHSLTQTPIRHTTTALNPLLNDLSGLKQRLATLNIQIYYASPLPRDIQVAQLIKVLESDAEALILLAYGLGNLPKEPRLVNALLAAEQRGMMVVLSSQVPFGGVESRYAAGNWLKQCGVLSAEELPIAAIFARLAWLHVSMSRYSDRRKAWLQGTIA